MTKTAFVTGGTGFLGLNLVEQLCRQGWRVTALHRASSDLSVIGRFPVELAEGDILDPGSLAAAVPRGVDAVFHLAADVSVWSRHDARQTRINVEGTRNVCAAALAAGAGRLVHTSTWNVYGLWQGVITEDSPKLGDRSPVNYDRTKHQAEVEVRRAIEQGLDAVIVNPCHILGRYDSHGWARLMRDLPNLWLPGTPPGSGSFCHAEQVAKAQIAAIEAGQTARNYLLPGADASFLEVFRTIGEVTGWSVPRRALPAFAFRLAGHFGAAWGRVTGREPEITPEAAAMVVAEARVVAESAVRDLGYRVVPLRAMIEDSYRWLVAEGLIAGEDVAAASYPDLRQ